MIINAPIRNSDYAGAVTKIISRIDDTGGRIDYPGIQSICTSPRSELPGPTLPLPPKIYPAPQSASHPISAAVLERSLFGTLSGQREDELEKNIADLMTQAGVEEVDK
ncbi:Hypp2238 [Branchiostoma lanceolatum]|uniref:Hypp2238 protein n=1 Tax=Branchiostoma lanceolatum TaxID=7740 RepID=A0A8J9ZRZ3_BRALA|nr:Hypp2238 [Branchiostoma lanceolatum]